MPRKSVLRLAGLVVGAALVVTGCGGNSGDSANSASTPSATSAQAAPGKTDDAAAPAPGTQPRIAILATGGTIAGKANANSAVGYTAGEATAKDLIDAVPGIDKIAKLSAEQISNIGSQDMNDDVWVKLADRINQLFARNEVDGVVVTHGTDTIEETAFFLDHVVASDKPVVLVGSMRPSTALSADGPANLRSAVQVAASPAAAGRGTMVVLNDTIHGASDVTKTNTTSVQTFVSPNSGPIGHVDAAAVTFTAPLPKQPRLTFPVPGSTPLPRVDIIYSHAGMNADQVNDALGHGAKGLVLAGVGDGNTSKAVVDALSKAAKSGVVVVRSSRVGSGSVVRNAELNDDDLGTVSAMYLNPAKSRVLVQLLLANGITDPAKVQQDFADC
ncbi:type II asparaginase [Nocardia sp. ET3-3]|uniref:asparaginase n=1 Tax=Nocardia terrae TaxID=2675851 RepID=A0A7K1UR95_9NOCA|nr:asparaginase [Nocardia terrae]MVU76873.1 type II asparaginase [Nocardia terrae]